MSNSTQLPLTFMTGDPKKIETAKLIEALSQHLLLVTGRDGRASFSELDIQAERAVFVEAYRGEELVGCGALRPLSDDIGEVKRMFAKHQGQGIGANLLRELEHQARSFRYRKLVLETGIQNQQAIHFYVRNGYDTCPNYGKYLGRSECVCFAKIL